MTEPNYREEPRIPHDDIIAERIRQKVAEPTNLKPWDLVDEMEREHPNDEEEIRLTLKCMLLNNVLSIDAQGHLRIPV